VTAFEAAPLIKPPALRGVSDYGGGIEVVASNYTTIENCNVSYSYFHGIWVWHSTMDSTYGVIQDCTVSYSGATGINLADHARYWTIQNNAVHHNSALSAVNLYTAGIRLVGDGTVSNITIQDNQVYSNGLGQAASIGAGIWIDTQGQNDVVRWNNVYGNQFDNIRIEISPNNQVYYNVAYGSVGASGISVTGRIGAPISGVVVYNNTSYGNHVSGLQAWGDCTAGSIVNNTFKNNISVGNGTFQLDAGGGGENDGTNGSGNVYTYNDFGAGASNFIQWGFGNYESAYAAWETATGNCGAAGCSDSVQSAPTFANAGGGQFWLTSGSPGIDAGLNLGSPYNIGLMPGSTWPNSVVTGNQNAYGSGWEIGTFIYVPAGPAPPTNLQAVAH
jgi:parallel beta-helix repeat protein